MKSSQPLKDTLGLLNSLALLQIFAAGFSLSAVGSASEAAYVRIDGDLAPALARSDALSPSDPNKTINIVLLLRLKDSAGAQIYAERVNTPGDSLYKGYLTPQQFGDRFGLEQSAYDTLKASVVKSGLTINEPSLSRTTLSVHGSVAQIESFLQTTINNYRAPDGMTYYSAATGPVVAPEISRYVKAVIGLSNYVRVRPSIKILKNLPALKTYALGSRPGGADNAADLRATYGILQHLSPSKTGTVAVYEPSGFQVSDIIAYKKANKLPDIPIKARLVNGFGGAPNPFAETQVATDIELIIGINPNLKEMLVYEDGDDPFGVSLVDCLTAIANDNAAQTLNISYGVDEALAGNTQISAEGTLFEQLAAQGITVFVASGDYGAYGDSLLSGSPSLNVFDTAAQPFVISIGGTSAGGFESVESVWNFITNASGGGVSSFWKLPTYQIDPTSGNSVALVNGGSATMRNVPDAAAIAAFDAGVAVYANAAWKAVAGTNVASTVWTGFSSINDATSRYLGLGGVGFLNPVLYQLCYSPGLWPGELLWITEGSNGDAFAWGLPGYNAGWYYNNCVGLGSLFASGLALNVLESSSIPGRIPDMPRGLGGQATGKTTAALHWTPVPDASGYLVFGSETYATRETRIIVEGLVPNSVNQIGVNALNRHGSSLPNYINILTPK